MRRLLSVGIAVMALTVTVVSAPALAAGSSSDVKPDKVAAIAAFDMPDVDHAVALHCRGRVGDRGAAVECAWRAHDDVEVASWQLWRLRIRPEGGGRERVAELRPGVTSYTDTNVKAPASYLYVVLGLDQAGEIIARSRPALARVLEHPHRGIHLACHLQRTQVDAVTNTATVDAIRPVPQPAIGCRWEPSDHAGIRGYVVHRSVDGGEREVIAEVEAAVTSIVDYRVAFGHRYAYMVSAVDHEGHVLAHSRVVNVGVPPWIHDRVTDRPSDKPTDRVTDRHPDPVSDKPTDRVTDRHPDPVRDKPTDRVTDRHPDPVSDKPTDRVTDHPSDTPTDGVTDHPSDKPTDRVTDRHPDPESDEITDSASDREPSDIDHDRVIDAIADRDIHHERPADRLPTDR